MRTIVATAILAPCLAVSLALAWPQPAAAEKALMSPKAMLKISTHVVIGKVRRIYTTQETEGNWKVTRYAAEVRVEKVEKGEGTHKTMFVRYWTRRWGGRTPMPPSTTGHTGLPKLNETLRVYLAKDSYNGFGKGDNDGGFDVIGSNGFERLKKK